MASHQTVLKQEAVDALVQDPDGVFLDCTFGRGGHTELILERLSSQGKVIAIDKDLAAIAHAKEYFSEDARLEVVHGSFKDVADILSERGLDKVSGALLDLGVSSPQLDEAERGFSFRHDGPLDMRMNQAAGQTAAEWLNTAKASDVSYVIKRYGEEKHARRIANGIVAARELSPLTTTFELVKVIEEAIPAKAQREMKKHPATKTFQAIRIYLNEELQDLEDCLGVIVPRLEAGGRLVVISFHSLEDRIVKRFIREQARGEQLPSRLPIRDADVVRHLEIVGKPVKPTDDEVSFNRRSRSSIMRVAERTS